MDQQGRIKSEKHRLEENQRKLSRLSVRENHEETKEKQEASNATRFDYIFKIVIIGDATCGKTSLMKRYVDNNFHCDTMTTIGVDFNIKTFSVEDKIVKLQIWDTAGQEKFAPVGSLYYRGANAVVVTYDITNRKTFDSVEKWREKFEDRQRSEQDDVDPQTVLVGCKTDLEDLRQVSREAGQTKAIKLGCKWLETSSKSGDQVDTLFEDIARSVLHNKKNSLNDRLTSVGMRASVSAGGQGGQGGQGGPGGERRAQSVPAALVRRITTLRGGNKAERPDPSAKSRWKCSIL